MKKQDHTNGLRLLLRAHDPAGDRQLSDADVRQMRARILGEAKVSTTHAWWRPVWALVVLLAILAIAVNLDHDDTTGVSPERFVVSAEAQGESHEATTRQIQYETPGGTRVIWTLDSDFEL